LPDPSAKETARIIARFEEMGPKQVQTLMLSGGIVTQNYPLAMQWLAEKDQEAARLTAASQIEMAATASRAVAAAERAATAAETQARTAKQALTTAIIATATAVIALIMSIIAYFHIVF
jgi:hypothetical protein